MGHQLHSLNPPRHLFLHTTNKEGILVLPITQLSRDGCDGDVIPISPKKKGTHDFEVMFPLKPKRLKTSYFDKAMEVIKDDGKLLVLEVIFDEDEKYVNLGHL